MSYFFDTGNFYIIIYHIYIYIYIFHFFYVRCVTHAVIYPPPFAPPQQGDFEGPVPHPPFHGGGGGSFSTPALCTSLCRVWYLWVPTSPPVFLRYLYRHHFHARAGGSVHQPPSWVGGYKWGLGGGTVAQECHKK